MIDLRNTDCLELLKNLPDASVDLILEDMPYGTTQLEWDKKHPELTEFWQARKRIAKHNAVYVLFCDEPFTSFLLLSNLQNFRQKLTWDKIVGGGFLNAHKMFLDRTEDILIFSEAKNGNYTFNPTKQAKHKDKVRPLLKGKEQGKSVYGKHKGESHKDYNNEESFPTNVLEFGAFEKECNGLNRIHPTQKPVDLFRYLIKTYTNENDTVFDGFSGSGTTAIACIKENRNFIGSELDATYYENSIKRIQNEMKQQKMF